MAAAYAQTITASKLVSEFKAIYSESLRDAISDVDLAPLLLDSNFFTIRSAADQELFFATSSYLDEFLLSAVPATVTFVEDRLAFWGRDALDFARENVGHSSFVDFFSSGLQHEQSIQTMLRFDETGSFLREYFKEIRINSVYFAEALPGDFRAAVASAARTAVQPALMSLAVYLKRSRRLALLG